MHSKHTMIHRVSMLLASMLVAVAMHAAEVDDDSSPPSVPEAPPASGNQPAIAETFEARAKAALDAAMADPAKLTGGSPMHYWVAQRLFEQGEKEKALAIVKSGVKAMRAFIERRERENHNNIGYNGFIYWSALNCYVHWHQLFDQELLDDYRYSFTHAHNYKGTTGNLSMIHTLALLLADNIWGAENLPKNGNYGARGAGGVRWLTQRVERIAKFGSGEYASRPYMTYNVGTLLTLNNEFVDESLRRKAAMAYEMSIAHAAGTWLRGNWATPSGRSYPDQLSQQPSGSAALLWTYFGGIPPRMDAQSAALFSAAEKFRPHPILVTAATDRSKAYVHRSRFDGDKLYQTSYINKAYALFSTATAPATGVWGQTYPYGVMYDQPDISKGSHLWLTVPCFDDKPLTNYTHGVETRIGQYLQNKGSFLLVAKDLDDPKKGFRDRIDEKTGKVTNKTFRADCRYVLGYIPGGSKAFINDSKEEGRVFFNYGSALIAISSSEKFEWNPKSGIHSGSPRPDDSEFRIFGKNVATAIETALPEEYPGATPEEKLQAFRKDIVAKTKLGLQTEAVSGAVMGTYTDRFGETMEKTFDGPAKICGKVVEYESWPLVDNPWVHQDWNGNMTVTDGKTVRLYDVTNWTITETKKE